jgi:type I restriction enzyme M protein
VAKSKGKESKAKLTVTTVLETARTKLSEKGYVGGKEHPYAEGKAWLFQNNAKPDLLLCAIDLEKPVDEHQGQLAVLAGLTTCGGNPPPYVHVTNGPNSSTFQLTSEGERPLAEVPDAEQAKAATQLEISAKTDEGVLAAYENLQQQFDNIHEHIYATRENVSSSNEAIDELCKLVYMVTVLNRYQSESKTLNIPGTGKDLSQVLDPHRFASKSPTTDPEQAVREIRLAFDVCRDLKEFNITVDGEEMRIFEDRAYLRLEKPDTYFMALNPLLSQRRDGTNGFHLFELGDVTGRALEVVLRRKYEGRGGMGAYLTPHQVTRFTAAMAFVDLKREGKLEELLHRDERGRPTFRCCDPFAGSGGFLIQLIHQAKNYINSLVTFDDQRKKTMMQDLLDYCFIGADNSPGMVMKARINLAAYGSTHAAVRRVANSLTEPWFDAKIGTMDLIATNPPFKKDGVTRKAAKAGKRKEDEPIAGAAGAAILDTFMEGIQDGVVSIDPYKRCLGAKPDKQGRWKAVNSMDPAVLAIDRCLQLLKPGGRLLIVVPDGILCNSSYRYAREHLIGKKDEGTGEFTGGKAVLKAVVSLPQETFSLSGAGAKTSILYLQKKRSPADRQGSVFMAIANEVGFTVKNKVETQFGETRNELNRVLAAYEQGPLKEELK